MVKNSFRSFRSILHFPAQVLRIAFLKAVRNKPSLHLAIHRPACQLAESNILTRNTKQV
jgi:hypothetical protein